MQLFSQLFSRNCFRNCSRNCLRARVVYMDGSHATKWTVPCSVESIGANHPSREWEQKEWPFLLEKRVDKTKDIIRISIGTQPSTQHCIVTLSLFAIYMSLLYYRLQ